VGGTDPGFVKLGVALGLSVSLHHPILYCLAAQISVHPLHIHTLTRTRFTPTYPIPVVHHINAFISSPGISHKKHDLESHLHLQIREYEYELSVAVISFAISQLPPEYR
jgi:hypothetical protein